MILLRHHFRALKTHRWKIYIKKKKENPNSVIRNNLSISNLFYSNNSENVQSDLGGLDLLTPVFHSGNGSSNCFWGVPNPFTPHSAFPESETWLVFDTCPLFISSHVGAVFVAVSVCLGGGAHCFPVWSAAAGRQIDFRDGLLFSVSCLWFFFFFLFWRLICSSVHRGGIGATVFFCLFVFYKDLKVGIGWWWRDLSRKLRWGENSDKVSDKFKEKNWHHKVSVQVLVCEYNQMRYFPTWILACSTFQNVCDSKSALFDRTKGTNAHDGGRCQFHHDTRVEI